VVVETAAGRGAFVCGYHANQSPLAPEKYLTGAEWAWGNVYTDFIKKAQAGEKLGNFVRGGLKDGFVKMSPLGPGVSAEARKKFDATLAEAMTGKLSVFKGPLKDNKGNVVIAAGKAYGEDAVDLESMAYLAEGVVGSTS
jgi:simple sugar transport system substrate-binding protein